MFTISLVNLHRKEGSYSTIIKACDYCGTKTCYDCLMQYTDQLTLGELADQKTETGTPVRVKILFRKGAKEVLDFSKLDKVDLHSSLDSARKSASASASSNTITIQDCLNYDKVGIKLEEGNEWFCGECKNHVLPTKKLELYRIPKILIFHFKRFKQRGYMTDKIDKLIDFPLDGLDLSPYYSGTGSAIYDCYGVSNHYGSLSFGHYTAYCKNK
jgi:hypothetical protein